MASKEGSLDEAPTHRDATLSPMELILKELTELRKANQKLNDRLDSVLQRSQTKKSLFGSKSHSSVNPSCSVSTYVYSMKIFVKCPRIFKGIINGKFVENRT